MAARERENVTLGARVVWGRRLALATAVVFCVSMLFPVVTGLAKNTAGFPGWWGGVDVGLAFALGLMATGVMQFAEGRVDGETKQASYRAYRVLLHGILVMLVVFFVAGDRISWRNCLTGLAWRFWLLLFGLPAWLRVVRGAGE